MAKQLLASVGSHSQPQEPRVLLADGHRPYPQAILDIFGVTRFCRRHGRGRRKEIRQQIADLELGQTINTAHIERLNGTLRGQKRVWRGVREMSPEPSSGCNGLCGCGATCITGQNLTPASTSKHLPWR